MIWCFGKWPHILLQTLFSIIWFLNLIFLVAFNIFISSSGVPQAKRWSMSFFSIQILPQCHFQAYCLVFVTSKHKILSDSRDLGNASASLRKQWMTSVTSATSSTVIRWSRRATRRIPGTFVRVVLAEGHPEFSSPSGDVLPLLKHESHSKHLARLIVLLLQAQSEIVNSDAQVITKKHTLHRSQCWQQDVTWHTDSRNVLLTLAAGTWPCSAPFIRKRNFFLAPRIQ